LLLPLLEEAAIAGGELLVGIDAEDFGEAVDPVGGAFELGEDAERRFIEDAMGRRIEVRIFPFGAPFFIAEGGDEADGGEDVGEGLAVGEIGFGFDAVLVLVFSDAGVGDAFVGEEPLAGVVADAENFSLCAEGAVWCVVEGVGFEAARGDEVEAGGGELSGECVRVRDAELDFCFDRAHGGAPVVGEYTTRAKKALGRIRPGSAGLHG